MCCHITVCDKEEFVNSNNLQSILCKVLRNVYLSLLNIRQWRRKHKVDSISKPQLQIGFKWCLKMRLNLCSHKWLRPMRNLLISLIPKWLSQFEGLINFRILFLKTTKLFEFWMVESKLFHSVIVKGKKVVSSVRKGMLSAFRVAYGWVFQLLV